MSTTQSVATAMTAVVASWHGMPDEYTRKYGCRSSVEAIQSLYPTIREQLLQAKTFLVLHWLDIEENRKFQEEVKHFLDTLQKFLNELRNFENEFCVHDEAAFCLFDDAWIARKYFVMMLDLQQEYEGLMKEFKDFGKVKPSPARPFKGMAAAFRSFFVGVKDVELEDLILYHKPFSRKHEWLGRRVEAAIFAEAYGLEAKHMNQCFNIKGTDGFHRNLNLASERATLSLDQYAIWAAIEKYKHCRV